jgi:hypothetical protein
VASLGDGVGVGMAELARTREAPSPEPQLRLRRRDSERGHVAEEAREHSGSAGLPLDRAEASLVVVHGAAQRSVFEERVAHRVHRTDHARQLGGDA